LFRNSNTLLLTAVLFFLAGVYLFVFSESGALERKRYEEKHSVIMEKIEALKSENSRLEAAAGRRDTVVISDEDLARAGYVKKGSKLIFNKAAAAAKGAGYLPSADQESGVIAISHLRVVWIVISALTILLLVGSRYRKRDRNE
jgi:hypothetical protein